MRRRLLPYLIPAALTLAGSLAAHFLAYRIASPHDHERERLLEGTGHGYLNYVPVILACLLALVAVGLGGEIAHAIRGGSRRPVRVWQFGLVPFVAFVLQEHLERYFHSGGVPLDLALEPLFLIGLALQAPFALAALAACRALLGFAHRAGRALGSLPSLPRLRSEPVSWPVSDYRFSLSSPFARCNPKRGPPAFF